MSDGPKFKRVESGQGFGFVLERPELIAEEPSMVVEPDRCRITELTDDEDAVHWRIQEDVLAKLTGEGRREYGPMVLRTDERDLLSEAIDECTDTLVYLHMLHRRQGLEPVQIEFKPAPAYENAYKLVYMAHPVSGQVQRNLARASSLLWDLREQYEDTHNIIAPWISECQQFDDSDPEQRRRGLAKCKDIIAKCDALWLCGHTISAGMAEEAAFARAHGVEVVDCTEGE